MLSCPYFVKKSSILWKTRSSYAHILSKKTSILSKHGALMLFFSTFSWKNPLLCFRAQDRSKKSQFYLNYTLLWAKKVRRMPLSSLFSRKNICSHAHILSKKIPSFSKKQTALMPIFCRKKRPFSQKHCALMSFFKTFNKNPYLHAHIWSKNVNSVKTTLF